MTLDDWRALDARIARMMGWIEWDDIPRADRDSILRRRGEDVPEILSKASPEWRAFALETVRAFWWEHHDEHGWIHAYERRDWQPHKDVAQAIGALERLSEQGVNYSITRFTKHEAIVQLWGYLDRAVCVRRRTGEILRETICLAIEAWLDAQGDGASG